MLHDFINLNINFTFVFPSCKCVGFLSTMRYNASFNGEFFFEKKEFIFFILSNLLRKGHILSNFQRSFISNSFWIRSWAGSGMIFPDPDPAKSFGSGPRSGSTTLTTYNTYYPCTEGWGEFRECDWSRGACYDWLCAVCLRLGRKSSHSRSDQCSGGPTD